MNKLFIVIIASLFVSSAFATAGACAARRRGLSTAGTGVSTCSGDAVISACKPGYFLKAANECSPCLAGTYNVAGDADTIPNAGGTFATKCGKTCPAGYFCPANTLAADTTNYTICPLGYYCPLVATGAVDKTACPAGYACASTGLAAPVPCASGQFSTAGATTNTCATATTGTAITGCLTYTNDAKAQCALGTDGYVTVVVGTPVTAQTGNILKKCVDNCKTCSGITAALCTVAASGYGIQTATDGTVTITACQSDMKCTACTIVVTATATTVTCTKAAAGYLLTAVAPITAVRTPAGFGSAADNTLTASTTACTTAKNCATCFDVDTCETCSKSDNYVFAAGVCTKLAADGTKVIDITCSKAQAYNDANQCIACGANRVLTDSGSVVAGQTFANGVGKCLPVMGFYETVPITAAPVACGANVADCTAAVVKTCKPTYIAVPAVNPVLCAMLTDTLPGFLKNAASTNFDRCNSACLSCAGTITNCVTCAVPAGFVPPTSLSADYATKLSKFIPDANGACSNSCNATAVPNANRDGCVLSTSNSSILSILLVAIIALLL